MIQLRLNPAIKLEPYARAFAERKIVQIPDFFEPQSALALEAAMLSLPWRLVYQTEKLENVMLTREQIAAMSPAERAEIDEAMRKRAARGIGFTYFTYPMIPARIDNWDPGHPIHALTDFLNSPPFILFASALIGDPGITKIDAHASNYRPGDYLTVHQDHGEAYERRAAYTLGFSRDWRADWGGALVFLDEKGDVTRGFIPRFNVLTVFDGMMPHAVTAVAPFTPNPRLSVAGWFRNDPPFNKR